jgi:hypothetical protein
MVTKTFEARVVNGQLQHDQALDAFEGQQVRITLVAPASAPPNGQEKSLLNGPEEPPEVEPPEWLDVEKDVYVRMPGKVEILENVTLVDCGPGRPSLIFPEELPDE